MRTCSTVVIHRGPYVLVEYEKSVEYCRDLVAVGKY